MQLVGDLGAKDTWEGARETGVLLQWCNLIPPPPRGERAMGVFQSRPGTSFSGIRAVGHSVFFLNVCLHHIPLFHGPLLRETLLEKRPLWANYSLQAFEMQMSDK